MEDDGWFKILHIALLVRIAIMILSRTVQVSIEDCMIGLRQCLFVLLDGGFLQILNGLLCLIRLSHFMDEFKIMVH